MQGMVQMPMSLERIRKFSRATRHFLLGRTKIPFGSRIAKIPRNIPPKKLEVVKLYGEAAMGFKIFGTHLKFKKTRADITVYDSGGKAQGTYDFDGNMHISRAPHRGKGSQTGSKQK